MANRKIGTIFVSAILVLSGLLGTAMAPKPKRLTMIVVPARFSVLQVVTDIANRYPVVLVTYQGDASSQEPLLHAWNGREWAYVANSDYQEAGFLQRIPAQTVLVGDEELLPEILISASAWCPMVMSIPSIDTATLINSFGKVFGFKTRDWKWFAKRYNLSLLDLDAEQRKESWYDRSMAENLQITTEDDTIYDDVPETYIDTPLLPEIVVSDSDEPEEMDSHDMDLTDENVSMEEDMVPEIMEESPPEMEDVLEETSSEEEAPLDDEEDSAPEDWEETAIAPIPSTIK